MKVLVIGSGGREHSLCWKIAQSPKVEKVYCAPGNGGISKVAEIVDISVTDYERLLAFVWSNEIGLTVVGPEVPLGEGIVDKFQDEGYKIFGPIAELARLESSKIFAKEIMKRYNVPTADYEVFVNSNAAVKYIEECGKDVVIKADGLCAGKGVIIPHSQEEAKGAAKLIMDDRVFGDSGCRILVEEKLIGEEVSILVFTDGKTIVPLASSQDHKRIFDNDKGPNTGGMGAYSPAPVLSGVLFDKIIAEMIEPLVHGLASEGRVYKGVLYAGLMITDEGPKVLEFNVRFGDPEAQAIIPRLKSDIVEVMEAVIEGRLSEKTLEWDERACVCVVCTSGGYPGEYEKGKVISGLKDTEEMEDVMVFHSGTRAEKTDDAEKCLTNGGRVLGVTALGEDIEAAKRRAYEGVSKISFENMHFRKDIADKAVGRLVKSGV